MLVSMIISAIRIRILIIAEFGRVLIVASCCRYLNLSLVGQRKKGPAAIMETLPLSFMIMVTMIELMKSS